MELNSNHNEQPPPPGERNVIVIPGSSGSAGLSSQPSTSGVRNHGSSVSAAPSPMVPTTETRREPGQMGPVFTGNPTNLGLAGNPGFLYAGMGPVPTGSPAQAFQAYNVGSVPAPAGYAPHRNFQSAPGFVSMPQGMMPYWQPLPTQGASGHSRARSATATSSMPPPDATPTRMPNIREEGYDGVEDGASLLSGSNSRPDFDSSSLSGSASLGGTSSRTSSTRGGPQPELELFVSANVITSQQAKVESSARQFAFSKAADGSPILVQSSPAADLYRSAQPAKKKVVKPTSADMEASELFQAFAEDAVVQGTEEDTPRLCLDPAQVASLQNSLHAPVPAKVQPVLNSRIKRFPLHESAERFLEPPAMDPIVASAKDSKKMDAEAGSILTLSKQDEALDGRLRNVQEAIKFGLAATVALQQGLGKIDRILREDNPDPAIARSAVAQVFRASQDSLDQMGRASAITHHTRRVHAIRGLGLTDTPYETQLLQLPLAPGWLFGEAIHRITDTVRAQKSAATDLNRARKKSSHSATKKKYHHGNSGHHNQHHNNRQSSNQGKSQKPSNNQGNRQHPYGGHQHNNNRQPFRQGSGRGGGYQAGGKFSASPGKGNSR